MSDKTVKRVRDIRGDLNVSLPSYKSTGEGSFSLNHEDWATVHQSKILAELRTLNTLLACPNFIGIPKSLREIKRAVNRIPAIARPRKPKVKK